MLVSFYAGSFSYTIRAAFIFIWGVSLTHPMLASFFCGEFFLQIPCWLYFSVGSFSLTHPMLASFSNLGSFSYTSRTVFIFSAESLFNIPCCFIFIWGVSLTYPMLILLLYGEFFFFFFFIWGVSLQIPR